MASLQGAIEVATLFPFILMSPEFDRDKFAKLTGVQKKINLARGCTEDETREIARLSAEASACFEPLITPQQHAERISRLAADAIREEQDLVENYLGHRWTSIRQSFSRDTCFTSLWSCARLVSLPLSA